MIGVKRVVLFSQTAINAPSGDSVYLGQGAILT